MLPKCDPGIAKAAKKYINAVGTTYTLTSRRYSIWSLLSKHLDKPVGSFLEREKTYVNLRIDAFSESARNIPHELEGAIKMALRFNSKSNQECGGVCDTLETIRGLLKFTLTRKSKTITRYGARFSNTSKSQIDMNAILHHPHCELCWRLSQYEQAVVDRSVENGSDDVVKKGEEAFLTMGSDDAPEGKAVLEFASASAIGDIVNPRDGIRYSHRYCSNHLPGTATYRRDHNNRDAYSLEISRVQSGIGAPLSEVGIRKLAYELVRYKMCEGTTKRKMHELCMAGHNQSQIATLLGVSRQAVSKAIKQFPRSEIFNVYAEKTKA